MTGVLSSVPGSLFLMLMVVERPSKTFFASSTCSGLLKLRSGIWMTSLFRQRCQAKSCDRMVCPTVSGNGSRGIVQKVFPGLLCPCYMKQLSLLNDLSRTQNIFISMSPASMPWSLHQSRWSCAVSSTVIHVTSKGLGYSSMNLSMYV